jgi:hypothetical protein
MCPRGDGAPARQICPHGFVLQRRLPPVGGPSGWSSSWWLQRLVLAFGVIEDVLLRKSNIAGFEAYSGEGAAAKVVCPRCYGAPARQVCPRGGTLQVCPHSLVL